VALRAIYKFEICCCSKWQQCGWFVCNCDNCRTVWRRCTVLHEADMIRWWTCCWRKVP